MTRRPPPLGGRAAATPPAAGRIPLATTADPTTVRPMKTIQVALLTIAIAFSGIAGCATQKTCSGPCGTKTCPATGKVCPGKCPSAECAKQKKQ